MGSECTVQSKLHHERLGVGQLCLATPVERLRDKQVLAQDPLDDLKMLVWVVCLAEGLLPGDFTSSVDTSMASEAVAEHGCLPSVQPLLLLLRTLFEEDFSQDVFLLFVGVVVLDVVVMRLVENAI